MDFTILGPVEVRAEGRVVPLSRRRERCLLGILLLEAGKVVPTERLEDLLWDDDPPRSATGQLRANVSRLRSRLKGDGNGRQGVHLVAEGGGYVAHVDPMTVDAHRFRHLVERAHVMADPPARAAALQLALRLWRGPLLADAASDLLRERLGAGLEEQYLMAIESAVQADLETGRPQAAIAALLDLTERYPLRERLAALLMTAYHRAGRQADALRVYGRLHDRLADELGLDPGPEVRALQVEILRGDPAADRRATVAAASGRPAPWRAPPAQLPPDIRGFTGRADAMTRLDRTVERHTDAALAIAVVSGLAGIGKTSLVVHWAHRRVDRFPDGQLYVNLRGFDPNRPATDPRTVLRDVLDALEVPAARIPVGLDGRTALFRSLLAGRRMLVVLDDARDAEQVHPLLPGSPSCVAVVTSRGPLPALLTVYGAHPVELDVLSPSEAVDVLAARLGGQRLAAAGDTVDRIVEACGGLPLALAVVAGRAAGQPDRPLAEAAGVVTAADPGSVFATSYHRLSEPARGLFRLLGRAVGTDVTPAAAASLAGRPAGSTASVIAELLRANLLTEHLPRRYTLHDLVRAYADLLGSAEPDATERPAAVHRMLDHYLHSAHAAALMFEPTRDAIDLPEPDPAVTVDRPDDYAAAMTWLTVEHRTLLAAVDVAAAAGLDLYVWRLSWALSGFLERRGYGDDWLASARAGMRAADRLADPVRQVTAARSLSGAYAWAGRLDDAERYLRRALALGRDLGRPADEAHTHLNMSSIHDRRGDHRAALRHAVSAVDRYRAAGHRNGEADALNAVGWYRSLLGDHEGALVTCQRALTLLQEIGDDFGEANTLDSIAHAYHHLGQYARAVAYYRRSLGIFHRLGDRYYEASGYHGLGDTLLAVGDRAAGRRALERAAEIFSALGQPAADEVRAKLRTVAGDPDARP